MTESVGHRLLSKVVRGFLFYPVVGTVTCLFEHPLSNPLLAHGQGVLFPARSGREECRRKLLPLRVFSSKPPLSLAHSYRRSVHENALFISNTTPSRSM